jgi:hypothetical protein
MNFQIKNILKIIIITMLNKFKAQQRCTLNWQPRKLLARHQLHFVQLPLVCYSDWIVFFYYYYYFNVLILKIIF